MDTNGDVLEILMQSRRNAHAAKRFLMKLMKRWGVPRVIVPPLVTLLRNALPGSDRDHVWQAQGLAAGCNQIRPMPKGLPLSHRTRSNRHLLAMSPDPSTLLP